MPVDKFKYTKDDGSVSDRTLLVTELPPKSFVSTLDLTGLEERAVAFYVTENDAYQQVVAEHMKKAPTFKQFLDERYPGTDHKPPFKSFKRDGLRKV
jgi:hypothetical protein